MSLKAVSTKEFSFWFGRHDLYWPGKRLISKLEVAETKKGVIVNYSASTAGNSLIERSFTLKFTGFDKVIELFEGIDSEKDLMCQCQQWKIFILVKIFWLTTIPPNSSILIIRKEI